MKKMVWLNLKRKFGIKFYEERPTTSNSIRLCIIEDGYSNSFPINVKR